MQSTVELFRHLYEHLPPLLPPEIKKRMEHALEHVEGDAAVTLPEIEDTMIEFGYEVWPFMQAHREFMALYEAKMGEHFLLPKLSSNLQERYADFKTYGGTLRDLHSGRPADFFSGEERVELYETLVNLQTDLRRYVDHQVVSTDRQKYLERIEEFSVLLEDIQVKLSALNDLARAEQDHPTLAEELRQQVRAFEYGLSYLGPELDYEALKQAAEHYHGRRKELSRFRGIHTPIEIDFYTEEAWPWTTRVQGRRQSAILVDKYNIIAILNAVLFLTY